MDKTRDIPKTPPNTIFRSKTTLVAARLHAVVALVLRTDSKGKKIERTDKMVADEIVILRDATRRVYARSVKHIAEKGNITIERALQYHWSQIPETIQKTSILNLERLALKERHLNLGRCEKAGEEGLLFKSLQPK